jgi:hypothetical protein
MRHNRSSRRAKWNRQCSFRVPGVRPAALFRKCFICCSKSFQKRSPKPRSNVPENVDTRPSGEPIYSRKFPDTPWHCALQQLCCATQQIIEGTNRNDKSTTSTQPRQQPGWMAEVPSSAGSRSYERCGPTQHPLAGDLRFRIEPGQSANVWLSTADPCRQSRTCRRVAWVHPNRSGIRSWGRVVDPRRSLRFCAASA